MVDAEDGTVLNLVKFATTSKMVLVEKGVNVLTHTYELTTEHVYLQMNALVGILLYLYLLYFLLSMIVYI